MSLPGDSTTDAPRPGKSLNQKTLGFLALLTRIEDELPRIRDSEFSKFIKNAVAQIRKTITPENAKSIKNYSSKLNQTWDAVKNDLENKDRQEELKSIILEVSKTLQK